MALIINEQTVVVFDLDDTLYPEQDYVRSGFNYLSQLIRQYYQIETGDELWQLFNQGAKDAIGEVCQRYHLPISAKDDLIAAYRYHQPDLTLAPSIQSVIDRLQQQHVRIAVITDGRGITQRSKLTALGLLTRLDALAISAELGVGKPDPTPYQYIMRHLPASHYVYIGDNPRKDFITAKQLGWYTVGIRDTGQHIHQMIDISSDYQPHTWLQHLGELQWLIP